MKRLNDDVHTDISVRMDCDSDNMIFEMKQSIYVSMDDDDEKLVGVCEGHVINNPMNLDTLIGLADMTTQQAYQAVQAIVDYGLLEHECCWNHVVVPETMRIEPAFRGRGIGIDALRDIVSFFYADVVLIKPCPLPENGKQLEGEKLNAAIKALQAYWARCGFQQIGNSEFWYCLLGEPVCFEYAA